MVTRLWYVCIVVGPCISPSSNVPGHAKNSFPLNSGINIKHIKNKDPRDKL